MSQTSARHFHCLTNFKNAHLVLAEKVHQHVIWSWIMPGQPVEHTCGVRGAESNGNALKCVELWWTDFFYGHLNIQATLAHCGDMIQYTQPKSDLFIFLVRYSVFFWCVFFFNTNTFLTKQKHDMKSPLHFFPSAVKLNKYSRIKKSKTAKCLREMQTGHL